MTLPISWRPLRTADLPALETIAARVHPDFFEEPAIFAERLALYPKGTHLLEVGGTPAGYVLSHPWRAGTLPALNALLGMIPDDADTYYVHDLALLPRARGTGAAGRIVAQLAAHARTRGLATMSLVAVNGSLGFWQKQGFVLTEIPSLAIKLQTYEGAARFMVKRLT